MTEMLKQAQVHVKTKAVMKKKIRLNNDIEKGTAQKLELSEEFFEGNGEEDADEKSSSKSFVDDVCLACFHGRLIAKAQEVLAIF